MDLPIDLKEKIDSLLSQEKMGSLIQGSQNLSLRYRSPKGVKQFLSSRSDRLAYLLTRMPATYAAIRHVLSRVKRSVSYRIDSMMDVGAGPGTGAFAAREEYPALQRYLGLEKDREFIALGKHFFPSGQWHPFDLCKDHFTFGQFDLVLCSYALNELPEQVQESVLQSLWEATGQVLILIEPGTPAGFGHLRRMRDKLLAWGAHMVAPCPHGHSCPIAGSDWCHFSERIERSSLHRKLKGAELNYEDEKFSYIAVSRTPVLLPENRIIRRPQKNSGHVLLTLCTKEGIQKQTITRKAGDVYKQVRKCEWGDSV